MSWDTKKRAEKRTALQTLVTVRDEMVTDVTTKLLRQIMKPRKNLERE